MSRRAFTLVEMLVALVAASIIIVLMYGTLVFYSRAYTREDEALERGRRGQEVLGLMRDDVERAQGEVQPPLIPPEALTLLGYQGNRVSLLIHDHHAEHIINQFSTLIAPHPYKSGMYLFHEAWMNVPPSEGIVRVPLSSDYVTPPDYQVKKVIGPITPDACVVHVPIPFDKPVSEYLVVRKVVGVTVTPVVWAFHRQKVGRWPAGSLLRWSPQTGVQSVGGDQIDNFELDVAYDFPFVDPVPPKRPDPFVQYLKMQIHVKLTFGRTKVRGPEPGFDMGAVFLVGP